jgi:hypothetical protein
MGPEIHNDTAVVAASNTSATNSGISWLTSRLCFLVVRATVVGIVIVVIGRISSWVKSSINSLPRGRRARFDVSQTLRTRIFLRFATSNRHPSLDPNCRAGYSELSSVSIGGRPPEPIRPAGRPRRRGGTADRDHMNPRTGSDAAEPPSRPSRPVERRATAETARNRNVTASFRSDIV